MVLSIELLVWIGYRKEILFRISELLWFLFCQDEIGEGAPAREITLEEMSSAAKEVDGTGTVDVSSSAAERLKTNQATSETLNENSAQQVTVILLCSYMDPKVIGQFQYRLNMSDANSQTSKILLIYNVFRALFNLQFTPIIRERTLLIFEYAAYLCFSSLFVYTFLFCFVK